MIPPFKILPQVLTAEKQTLARAWKNPHQSIHLTKNRIIQTMILNKIESTLTDKFLLCTRIWQSWVGKYLPIVLNTALLE